MTTVIPFESYAQDEKDASVLNEDSNVVIVAKPEVDPFALTDTVQNGKDWKDMNFNEKLNATFWIVFKFILLLFLLYLFVSSLGFLSDAFRLLGGKAAGKAISNNRILSNPISMMMIGILATVLLQSSSTTTSIVVTMVAADLLLVRPAIFIIMGANIGTSVTNTIVSMAQMSNRAEFRRAFAGATIHDMFNWLSVICILPIEWITGSIKSMNNCGILCTVTERMTRNLDVTSSKSENTELLKVITKPFHNLIIRLDKKIIKAYAKGTALGNETLVKHWCTEVKYVPEAYMAADNASCAIRFVEKKVKVRCNFLFENIANNWSDSVLGTVLLVLSLVLLCTCMVLIVKLLHSLLRGNIATMLRKFINADFPGVFKYLTGYVAIVVGCGLTMLVQSSSIFTSALTPLVGVGILHLDRMYPLTLGANIGTTFTAILAAMASERSVFQKTMQVALAHLFFNIFGILLWYPIPAMRRVPISMAKLLGNTTAKYRWFAIVYLMLMFFVLPGIVFALSIAGVIALAAVGIPFICLLCFIGIVNTMQSKRSSLLPKFLRSWKWLPLPLRSLAPYDNISVRLMGSCKSCMKASSKRTDIEFSDDVTVGTETSDMQAAPI